MNLYAWYLSRGSPCLPLVPRRQTRRIQLTDFEAIAQSDRYLRESRRLEIAYPVNTRD
jgi:hypothetical protein